VRGPAGGGTGVGIVHQHPIGLSPADPGEGITLDGRPRPSAARWILEAGSPRDRPIASSTTARSSTHSVMQPLFLGTDGVLVSPALGESIERAHFTVASAVVHTLRLQVVRRPPTGRGPVDARDQERPAPPPADEKNHESQPSGANGHAVHREWVDASSSGRLDLGRVSEVVSGG
jgi:hypothetical protein